MSTKICGRCKEDKDLSEFYKSKRGTYCKKCHSASSAESKVRNNALRIEKWLLELQHQCKKCEEIKPNEEFYWKSNRSYCKDCTQDVNVDYYERNREKIDTYRLQWRKKDRDSSPLKYKAYELNERAKKKGTTGEWYLKKFEEQNGSCEICRKPETSKHQNGLAKSLAIDHHHDTGKVRGLLCMTCNHALHKLDEDENWAIKALEYIQKYQGDQE